MLCYRDKWFCEKYTECKIGEDCSRALTEQVREDAHKWWGDSDNLVPISINNNPECFVDKNLKS